MVVNLHEQEGQVKAGLAPGFSLPQGVLQRPTDQSFWDVGVLRVHYSTGIYQTAVCIYLALKEILRVGNLHRDCNFSSRVMLLLRHHGGSILGGTHHTGKACLLNGDSFRLNKLRNVHFLDFFGNIVSSELEKCLNSLPEFLGGGMLRGNPSIQH